jgi:hypothetical protein
MMFGTAQAIVTVSPESSRIIRLAPLLSPPVILSSPVSRKVGSAAGVPLTVIIDGASEELDELLDEDEL